MSYIKKAASIQKNTAVKDIITDIQKDFNSDMKKHEASNDKLITIHPERLSDLNKMVRTLQAPNLIIRDTKDKKDYNYYIKNFSETEKNKAQFEVVKIATDGSFFSTSYPLNSNKFTNIINVGQVIFDLTYDSTAIQKKCICQ